jgi:diadenosine tetraphosphate (Ap4A) HIT family hydrolase
VTSRLELRAPSRRRFVLDPVCISCTAPENDPCTFAVSENWKLVLHPDQTVPGSLLIVSLRHVPKLSELTPAEGIEFFEVATVVERALEDELGATMVNFSCLRNWAFREANPVPPMLNGHPNPHVHWHVSPRYHSSVTICDEQFIDHQYGEQLRWEARHVTNEVQIELIRRLTKAIVIR